MDGNKRLAHLQARNGVEDPNQPCCHCDQYDTLLHLVSPVRQSDVRHKPCRVAHKDPWLWLPSLLPSSVPTFAGPRMTGCRLQTPFPVLHTRPPPPPSSWYLDASRDRSSSRCLISNVPKYVIIQLAVEVEMICYRYCDVIRNQVPSQMFPVQPIMLQRRIQNHPLALSSDPSKINRVRDSGCSAKKQCHQSHNWLKGSAPWGLRPSPLQQEPPVAEATARDAFWSHCRLVPSVP
ncbi:hypothetical protein DER46DRAFT_248302 [Fusarium sp. MPI-SDFR-AT-0072]|nr:hypothetical protein DER46DRAFT_248302 [Fusarium sp. MPI-SDFR-AT-0072]